MKKTTGSSVSIASSKMGSAGEDASYGGSRVAAYQKPRHPHRRQLKRMKAASANNGSIVSKKRHQSGGGVWRNDIGKQS